MRYQVLHTTIYDYAEPVSLCHNVLHLRAREAPRQTCLSQKLAIAPEPRGLQNRSDYYGNPIVLFTIQEPHHRLSVTAEHRFEIRSGDPVDTGASAPWEEVRDTLRSDRSPATLDAYRFVFTSQYVPRNQALAD
ncbi:MAG TPA: transglutaminase N-terminal domain-containing protein, partial [Gemmataceae bacterium]|nr:transglutaminase N-terminal domain-containing protein [Gemmataceae bacterium]